MRLTKEHYEAYKNYFLDRVYSDDIDTDVMNNTEKVQFVYNCFNSEFWKWHKERGTSMQHGFAEWLSGLPSCVNIPFANWEILELAEKITGQKLTGKEEDRVLENYWNFMSGIFFKLVKQHKIKAE